ncbi:MAG: NFACT RNA binding domain-containing protein [Clostridia bacterium]|nr:NFACT RNA binding domain-containing protein [Clostridia bacterium]
MSLDGLFLHCIRAELENSIIGAKVDKVYQPSSEELVFSLRTRKQGGKKLLLSARANSPRINLTGASYENPASPPMLCMLLRKRLGGATVTAIRQNGCDRILFLDFLAVNEMGEKENLSLAVEIMAQYSNVVLVSEDGMIIDALKRVDFTKSSKRLVLPGVKYELPPAQDKVNILEETADLATERIMSFPNKTVSSATLSSVMGVSPIVSRELSYIAFGEDVYVRDADLKTFSLVLDKFKREYAHGSSRYCLLKDEDGKPFDFSFMPITQYGGMATVEYFDNASELLDEYYSKRDSIERMTHKTADLRKLLQSTKERIIRKIDNQRIELKACENRETLRVSAELINANLYQLKKGESFYDIPNYYDDNKIMRVSVDPALSPAQNSQKYFKEYKKTYTAEKKLTEQIEAGVEELNYLDTVLDELLRAENERDVGAVKEELLSSGYIRNRSMQKSQKIKRNGQRVKQKTVSSLPPKEYETTDGFRVLVGRNNLQNDKLSMKSSEKLDMWLHTKDYPGSHVIIVNKNGEVSDRAIEEAAVIAAVNSTARDAHKVPVDYTLVKNLKKPTGARPGKVIFHENWTVYVTPDEAFAESLRVK